MKKSLARKITLSILAGAVLMSSSVVWAATAPSTFPTKITIDSVAFYTPVTGTEGTVDTDSIYDVNLAGVAKNTGDATGGIITITGGTFQKDDDSETHNFCGGYVKYSGSGDVDVTASVNNCIVNISGNETVMSSGACLGIMIFGGYVLDSEIHKGLAENNKVEISGGKIGNKQYDNTKNVQVFGGSAQGSANDNEVKITNVKQGSYFKTIYGGSATKGATGNEVVLSAENATYKLVFGGNANSGDISGNTVTISGGTFTDNAMIFGGVSHTGDEDAKKFINNTVTISGTADLTKANLYGGGEYFKSDGSCLAKYGGADAPNTLNIGKDSSGWSGEVKSIKGFDVINFNYINWSNGGNVVETETLALNDTKVDKVVIGSGNVKNGEWMNLISAGSVTGTFEKQQDITIRTGLTTSETVKGDIELSDNNLKLTIDDASIATDGIVVEPPSSGVSGGTGSSIISGTPSGAEDFVGAIEEKGSSNNPAYEAIDAVIRAHITASEKDQKAALTNMLQLGEAGGQSATAANISRNVSGATVNRMSFGGRGGHHHRGGHGPADFNEKDGSAVWAQYVHGKDKVDGMALADGVTTSYESQFNGVVLGVDFKEVGKYQSGIAFNYGEGDSHTKNIALSRSDYDFWGIGYYGAVKNADSNVIFDINYAKSDSEVKQFNGGVELEAEPETTTISAGVKVEKLIDKGAMQFVPYAGLRFMSVDTDEYSANYLGKEAFNYSADRQNIWLLPVGVSFRQENVYDSGWVVTPKVDLSYIWAFGDTENEMTVRTPDVAEAARLGYTVMNDGSFLGSIGLEAEKGDWTFGVAYSYQKSSDSRSDRWYVDAKYSF